MGAVRIAIFAAAAIVAIMLAFVVRGMVTPKKVPAAPVAAVAAPVAKPMANVLVASRDLPVGARLSSTDMTWQPWPVEALNPQFVTDGAAQGSGKQHPGETVVAQKAPLREDTGEQQRDVTLNHHEQENRIDPVAKDEVVKEVEMHD